MLGGGHMEDKNTGFDSEDRCKVVSVTLSGGKAVINCRDPFKNDHSGPKTKGGEIFRGAPVTLMHSTNHRVRVVGMEDDTKALSEQQYGVVLHVLAAKKRPMGKVGRRTSNELQLIQIRLAPRSSSSRRLRAPKECDKKQGT